LFSRTKINIHQKEEFVNYILKKVSNNFFILYLVFFWNEYPNGECTGLNMYDIISDVLD